MGFLDVYGGVRRVTIGDPSRGYWADLWEYVAQGGKEEAERALSKLIVVDGEAQIDPDTTRYRQLMVLAHIKEWNLDDDNGIWPLTLESVRRIPGPEFDRLWKIVDSLASPVQDSEEKLRFPDGGDNRDS